MSRASKRETPNRRRQGAAEEKRLREERTRAKEQVSLQAAALEAAANGILLTDPSGTILWANPAMTALTGYSLKELVGQKTKLLKSGHHPAAFYKEMWLTILAGQVWKGEMVNRRKNGSLYHEEMSITPVRDANGGISHFIAIKQDVTERNRAEKALREGEARSREQLAELEHIYATAPVGLALLDREMRILRINEQLAGMNGHRPEEHIGRTFREIIPEVAGQVEHLLGRVLATGEPATGLEVTTVLPETRQPRTALVSYYPLKDSDGSVRAINAVVIDITERQLMQKQIGTLQKFEAIGQLAGGIAHDFNNVIGAIQGWAELGVEETSPDDRMHARFEKIRDQAHRASGLTRQLLAFARRQVLEPRNLNLNQAVEGLAGFLRKAIPATVELKLGLAPNLATICADLTKVEQIVMNLCLNARDAMPQGGRLVIETRNVEIDEDYCRYHVYARPGWYVQLTVSDSGTGMDATTRERIFEPFFTTKEMGKGTGLGLATVYGIVKQHGGFIHVYSELGQGSVFRVYFPVVDAPAEEALRPETGDVRGGSETILVAEDHQGGREMVCEVLKGLGYTVLLAADGEEACRVFQAHQPRIDLLLFDVVMPRLSGPAAYRRIQAMRPGMPVLFATGYRAEAEFPATAPGVPAHLLQKPYSPRALARKVREILDGRPLPQKRDS